MSSVLSESRRSTHGEPKREALVALGCVQPEDPAEGRDGEAYHPDQPSAPGSSPILLPVRRKGAEGPKLDGAAASEEDEPDLYVLYVSCPGRPSSALLAHLSSRDGDAKTRCWMAQFPHEPWLT